jgi:phosphate transport system permease protein
MTAPPGSSPPLPPPAGPVARPSRLPARITANLGDVILKAVCQASAVLVIVLMAALVVVLFHQAWLSIRTTGLSFFTETRWDPQEEHRIFGALAFVYGTLATSLIAMAIAVPLGVGTAAYLSEIAPVWLRRSASFLVEMLAAIPSVVYGFWGFRVLAPALRTVVPWLGGPADFSGYGILAAGLVLAIMILPYVAAVSYDVCRAVPSSQRAGALALGATRWQMIWSVVLPYARPGIVGGCFLALGRALGETMAVTMLIGGGQKISLSLFAKGDSIASAIANQFAEATYDLYVSALVQLGLVLLLVSILVNALARLLIWRVSQVEKGRPFINWKTLIGRLRVAAAERRDGPAPLPAEERSDAPATPSYSRNTPGSPLARDVGQPRPAPPPRTVRKNPTALWVNHLMTGVLGLTLGLTIVPLFLIFGFLVVRGVTSIDLAFFTELPRPVGEKGGGLSNALVGSGILVGLATLFAVPLGLLAAIYLAEYRSDRLGPAVRFVGELLGGVPSIVIGIFTATLFLPIMHHPSGWAGSFALGVMMIPIVMRASEESLKLVPPAIRNASYALGATRWQTVLRVSVPAALPAIITGVFLAIARIGGETAPLLLAAGGNRYYPTSPSDRMPSLPVYIFNYAPSAYENWKRQGWAAALVLLVAVMLLNFGIRWLTGKRVLLASRAE